jgi:hypothetical protein
LFIAGVTVILLASCAPPARNGDNVAQINEAPLPNPDTSLLQGYVSQTRVSGAKCWIDRDSDNVLDFGEPSTTTSANGLFSITKNSLDDSANYRIICTGGSAQSVGTTSESVGVMLAPRGARNVTPLTTVVSLNSELADKIGQTLLSSSSQSYSEAYDVDIAKSSGTFGEHLQLAKGIETFMYVLGRSNPDLQIISSTQGHVAALKILADNLNELDSASIFDRTKIATKIGEAATDTLNSTAVDSLISLSAADISSIAADIQSSATAVMKEVATGAGRKITESSVVTACSNAFVASNLIANKVLSTKANSLPPYASSLTITDNLSSTLYSSSGGDFSVDNDSAVDNITVVFAESLANGASLNIDNITFTIANSAGATLEEYRVDNVTFAQSSTGVVSITINNAPGCDITTDKNSIILGYDNVTASCRTGTQNSLKGAAFNGGKFTVALIDTVSDNLSKSFEFNLTD